MLSPLFLKRLGRYSDRWGFLVGPIENGGDGCQRICMLLLGLKWNGNILEWNGKFLKDSFKVFLDQMWKPGFKLFGGFLRRHPDTKMWYSDWDRMSRDQITPLIIALSEFKQIKKLIIMMLLHIIRFGFAWNTRKNGVWKDEKTHNKMAPPTDPWIYEWRMPDFCGPEIWGLYIRGLRLWPLYPLLLLFDLETLGGALIRRFNDNDNVSNHLTISIYINRVMPTPVSWLVTKVNDPEDMKTKLFKHYKRLSGLPMGEIWQKLVC